MIAKGEFVKMSWDTVASFVTYAIAKILEMNYPCKAHSDAQDYWAIQLEDRMDMKKLEKIDDSRMAGSMSTNIRKLAM